MQAALILRLNAAAAITAITADRISWFDRVRGDGLPALALQTVSPGRDYTHAGADGLDGPRVRFDCWAGDEVTARALAGACITEMERPAEFGGVKFWPGELAADRDLPEPEAEGGQALFRVQLEFIFYHERI